MFRQRAEKGILTFSPVRYLILFVHEPYHIGGKPFLAFEGSAERLSSGSLQLPERAFCFDPAARRLNDPFVRIEVNGEELLFEKVKYDTNEAFGIERDKDGIYFLDRIRIDAHRGASWH